ncbi:hypothetical protein G7046_g6702 [Stylonectria norvegica]|nr:hypothetical protein G7046_g6702 [Stylonectria norvegica]
MSSGRGRLDPRHFQDVRQPLDSHPQLHRGAAHLHSQPPSTAAFIDASQFDSFSYPYEHIPDQTSLATLVEAHNGIHPTDVFPQHPTIAALDRSHSVSVHGPTFSATPSGHRRRSMNGSDRDGLDVKSPMTNSLDDSVADEFGLTSPGPADGTDLGLSKMKDEKSDSAPAWSELKTKAGKERKRLPLACIACRRKKIRCSGEKPACKHCSRSHIPCLYKVTARKAAPRTDYMVMLDRRLKRMEERMVKAVPKADEDVTPTVSRAVVKPAVPGTTLANKPASKKRGADQAFGTPALETWAKSSSKPKLADDNRLSSLQAQEAEETKLFEEGRNALPSKELQESLAEVFFDKIYGQAYYILHKPSYLQKLKNNTLPPVLILSVCAVGARFAATPELSSAPPFMRGEEWASHARDICMRRYEWPNITILTCLLILGLHEFGTCQGGRSWALGGQAIRMAFALQLHKDLERDPFGNKGKGAQLSFIDREIRRRTMWACFLMDRFNSSGTDRPMFIKEETLKIPLPIKEKYFQLDIPGPTETLDGQVLHPAVSNDGQPVEARDNMGVAAYMIRTISLWGRIIDYLNQGGKEADSEPMSSEDSKYAKLLDEADNFESTLPNSLKYSPDNLETHQTEGTASQFLFLHISIHQNALFLNRAAVLASNTLAARQRGGPDNFLANAKEKMVIAANGISDLLKEAGGSPCLVTAPFAGYCAFSSTTVHILGIVSSDPMVKATAEAKLATNIKFLTQMKKHWGMFHWMMEDVRTQYRKAIDASRAGAPGSDGVTGSTIIQYGDWFNRYPHGLSDADCMDPATRRSKEKGADGALGARPELQSVEDFFSTITANQGVEDTNGARPSSSKRKSTFKKQNGGVARHQLQPITTDLGSRTMSDPRGIQLQGQRFSGALGGQTSGPASYNPHTLPSQSQTSTFNGMSPISPASVNPYSTHMDAPPFFPPDLLSMNLSQPSNGILQPLDRQLVFGGYSMDVHNMAGDQNMLDGLCWNPMGLGARVDNQMHSRRASVKGGLNGHHHAQLAQLAHDQAGMADFSGHASSAWFVPFNMQPPEMTPDMNLSTGNIDSSMGHFGGVGGEMTTPNPQGGLRHGP